MKCERCDATEGVESLWEVVKDKDGQQIDRSALNVCQNCRSTVTPPTVESTVEFQPRGSGFGA